MVPLPDPQPLSHVHRELWPQRVTQPSGASLGPRGRRWAGQGVHLPDRLELSIQRTRGLPHRLLDSTLAVSRLVGVSLVFRQRAGCLQDSCSGGIHHFLHVCRPVAALMREAGAAVWTQYFVHITTGSGVLIVVMAPGAGRGRAHPGSHFSRKRQRLRDTAR